MDFCKDFLQQIIKLTLIDVYLILNDDIIPNIFDYISSLESVKFEDGSYHTFYGNIKHLINGFLTYYEDTIDIVYKEADKYTNVINREKLISLTQKTIDIHYDRQIFFDKKFLPMYTDDERKTYEEIQLEFHKFKGDMDQLKNKVDKLDKQDKVDSFAKEHFIITIRKTSELFIFAHEFIALMLSEFVKETKVSLEEILLRMNNNLKTLQEDYNIFVKNLRSELYKKNKNIIEISRQHSRGSIETAEAVYSIETIRGKIDNHQYRHPIEFMTEETCYWQKRLKDFNFIADCILKLKAEQENVRKQLDTYKKLRTTELPGSKKQCWLNMGENFRNRQEFLKTKILEISKTLMTFFAIPAYDNVIYVDNVGRYFLDSYNHKVYIFNHEMNFYHVDCNGDYEEVFGNEKYYYDVNGRYIKGKNGDKIYQIAPCTSQYRLGDDNLFEKITKDCGHSEKEIDQCKLQMKTVRRDTAILPKVEIKNIKETLSPEVVKYLWNSFGHLLPEALHDVGRDQPRNPIQYLAHKILMHKTSGTFSDLWKKKRQAEEYRSNIFKARKEKATVASKSWKAKQVKRRKPEESDDTEQRTVYNAYKATQRRIMSLNNED